MSLKRDILDTLDRIERLCPDTHLTLLVRWDDIIRETFGNPGVDLRAECLADLQQALEGLED